MWSGAIVWVQPRRRACPWTVMTLEPMPSMSAPICSSIRARSCTWGSEAALRMTVVPRVSAAAISAFSVAITEGSSIRKSQGLRPSGGAVRTISSGRSSTAAPRARNASRCGSRRRRPITSPPGGGMWAEPKRASSGPASRNEARIRSDRTRSTCVLSTVELSMRISAGSVHSTRAPRTPSRRTMSSTSEIWGTLRRITSSSVSRQAARIGSAPFLLPAAVIVPHRGTPPSMTNFSSLIDPAVVVGGRSSVSVAAAGTDCLAGATGAEC